MPPKPHKLSEERRNTALDNLSWLQKHPKILTAIANHYQRSSFSNETKPDTDAALYTNGFPSSQTENQCQQFHQSDLTGKMAIVQEFQDEATTELAIRLLCRNYGVAYRYPLYAAYQHRIRGDKRPLLDFRGRPRRTPKATLAEIEVERQNDLTSRQESILDDLEQYIQRQFSLSG